MKYSFCGLLLMTLLCVLSVCVLADGVLTLPASLKVIEEEAFYHTDGLNEVVLSEGLERIESLAFYGSGVSKINLPSTLRYIAEDAFNMNYPPDFTIVLGSYAHTWAAEQGVIPPFGLEASPEEDFEMSGNTITGYVGSQSEKVIIIPEKIGGKQVLEIGDDAVFANLHDLKSIEIPYGVTRIGTSAFTYCYDLRYIRIPATVKKFGTDVFGYGDWINADDLKIYGVPGTTAEEYAKQNGIPFVEDADMAAFHPMVSDFKINGTANRVSVVVGETLKLSGKINSEKSKLTSIEVSVHPSDDYSQGGVVVSRAGIETNTFDLSTLDSFVVGSSYGGFIMETGSLYDIVIRAENQKGREAAGSTTIQVKVTDPNSPEYRALLIGQDYIGNTEGISTLRGCAYDIAGMQSMLEDMPGTLYEVTKKSNLTKSEMLIAIDNAFAGANENDVSLFYYTGHGFTPWYTGDINTGALVGYDCEGLTVDELKKKLDTIPGKKIIILDSCHSGAYIGKSTASLKEAAEAFNQSVISVFASGTPKNLAKSGYYVLTSSHSTEVSWANSSSYSMFTGEILYGSGLNSSDGAMPADTSGDKKISLQECYSYAYENTLENQHAQVYPENSDFILWAK